MRDPNTPRWKVDTATASPFYESGGAHIIDSEGNQCCIYDQPGYTGVHERIFGCTFIIANNAIIGKVLWSKQYEGNLDRPNSSYMATIQAADQLPDWAILTAKGDAYRTNDFKTKQYKIPEYLDREITRSPEEAIDEAREDLANFLPPPPNWVLLHDPAFRQLMPQQVLDVEHHALPAELDVHSAIITEDVKSVSSEVLQIQRDMAREMHELHALQNDSEEKPNLSNQDANSGTELK